MKTHSEAYKNSVEKTFRIHKNTYRNHTNTSGIIQKISRSIRKEYRTAQRLVKNLRTHVNT